MVPGLCGADEELVSDSGIMKTYILIALLLLCSSASFAQEETSVSLVPIENCSARLEDSRWVKHGGWDKLFKVPEHPAIDSLRTERITDSLLAEINKRKAEVGDTLMTGDVFYIWKPYLEWIRYIDPHYSIIPQIPYKVNYHTDDLRKEMNKSMRNFHSNAKILPVTWLNINDTLVVDYSLSDVLEVGDRVLSVNGIDSKTILKYSYNDRHLEPYVALSYHYYAGFAPDYDMRIVRNGKEMTVKVPGDKYTDVPHKISASQDIKSCIRYYDEYRTGYIGISRFFPNNSRIIKLTKKALHDFKKKGAESVILDLRNNPGGSGHALDEFFSLFINKPEIDYEKSSKLKVSKHTINDYDFITEDMMGRLVDIPDEFLVKKVPLNNEEFVDGLKFYVLMDEGTGSTAASVCNVLQYNDAALLVGEPLLHNALNYGEVLPITTVWYDLDALRTGTSNKRLVAWLEDSCVSVVEIDEHTKAVDGVLMPDIHIPYVAREYMDGRDAMLEELLDVCSSEMSQNHNVAFDGVKATYRNGYILDLEEKMIGTYRNGYVFNSDGDVTATYRNGYVFDVNGERTETTYRNGFILD